MDRRKLLAQLMQMNPEVRNASGIPTQQLPASFSQASKPHFYDGEAAVYDQPVPEDPFLLDLLLNAAGGIAPMLGRAAGVMKAGGALSRSTAQAPEVGSLLGSLSKPLNPRHLPVPMNQVPQAPIAGKEYFDSAFNYQINNPPDQLFKGGIPRATVNPKMPDEKSAQLAARIYQKNQGRYPNLSEFDIQNALLKQAGQDDWIFNEVGRGMSAMPIPTTDYANIAPIHQENLRLANNSFNARYPRIGNSIKGINVVPNIEQAGEDFSKSHGMYDPKTKQIYLTPQSLGSPQQAIDTLFHEGTHHTQYLRPGLAKNFQHDVPGLFQSLGSYNPLEPVAYTQGGKFGIAGDVAKRDFIQHKKMIPSQEPQSGWFPDEVITKEQHRAYEQYRLQKELAKLIEQQGAQ